MSRLRLCTAPGPMIDDQHRRNRHAGHNQRDHAGMTKRRGQGVCEAISCHAGTRIFYLSRVNSNATHEFRPSVKQIASQRAGLDSFPALGSAKQPRMIDESDLLSFPRIASNYTPQRAGSRRHSPGAIALLGVVRSVICCPNRLPISSTAVRAVRPRSSRNGLSSTMSTDPTAPESCSSSMMR